MRVPRKGIEKGASLVPAPILTGWSHATPGGQKAVADPAAQWPRKIFVIFQNGSAAISHAWRLRGTLMTDGQIGRPSSCLIQGSLTWL